MIRHICKECGEVWYCEGDKDCEEIKDEERIISCVCQKCFPFNARKCQIAPWRIA